MKLVDSYLKFIQNEDFVGGYANPIQTRPLPKKGITGEDPKKQIPPDAIGPSGSEVDLDNDEEVGLDFRNFTQADYGNTDKKTSKGKS